MLVLFAVLAIVPVAVGAPIIAAIGGLAFAVLCFALWRPGT